MSAAPGHDEPGCGADPGASRNAAGSDGRGHGAAHGAARRDTRSAELIAIAGDLAAAAFSVPRDAVARCIDVGFTETAGVETYIAWGDAGPMSAVSVTPTGNTAGISVMATLPEHQRKGMGRGVERFHLSATEAGRPLYASLGFETIADLSAWVLGDSTQVHG